MTVAKGDTEILRVDERAGPPAGSRLFHELLPSVVSPGLAVIVTSTDGTVHYWNEAAAKLYGWRIDEAVGQNILDLTPARQSHRDASMIMSSLAVGQPWQGEIVLRRRDGVPFEAFVADFAIRIGDEKFIVGLSAPLSERRLIDRQRAEIEANVRAAIEGL
ncbi:MAG TPA: PAS domain-containing protein [Phenylobacterium sp.]